MRITNIEIKGQTGSIAKIHREFSSERGLPPICDYIEVTIHDADGAAKTNKVPANDRDAQYTAAKWVQMKLDGCVGTNSMVHDYFRCIELLGQ